MRSYRVQAKRHVRLQALSGLRKTIDDGLAHFWWLGKGPARWHEWRPFEIGPADGPPSDVFAPRHREAKACS
jgi:hypothetical protein